LALSRLPVTFERVVHLTTTGSSDVNYDVSRAKLSKPRFKCAFDRVNISGGYKVNATGSIAISKKSRPIHQRSENYITRLRGVDNNFINLYDSTDHRAWLVDGASGLLHLLRASLYMDQTGKLPHDSGCTALQLVREIVESKPYDKALSILRDNDFLNIRLYKNVDEIEEVEETISELTAADAVTKKTIRKVVKKLPTWYCIKDRVDEICYVLEQIMDH
jgi:hypothetical protein